MDGSKPVERRKTNVGTKAETVQEALSEARDRAQERRKEQERHHIPERARARESARREAQERQRERERERGEEYRQRTEHHRSGMPPRKARCAWLRDQPRYLWGVLGLGTVLLSLWAIFFWQKTITAEVEERSWTRAQVVERYEQIAGSDWCGRKPHDAYEVSSYRKQRGTRTVVVCRSCDCRDVRVKVGENCYRTNCRTIRRDNGNGSFDVEEVCDRTCDPVYENQRQCEDRTKQEPVYDQWCEYKVNRWRPNRTITQVGNGTQEPSWPSLTYNRCTGVQLGCERPGVRTQKYVVKFRDVKDTDLYTCEYPQQRWGTFHEGTRWQAIVKRVGGRFQCDEVGETHETP